MSSGCANGHLTKEQAEAIWAEAKRQEAERAEKMPTVEDALFQMTQAHHRLKELGWREAMYCPKDGTPFEVIEPGSSGIHIAHYWGEWPSGSWFIEDNGDLWPSRPCLFREIKTSVKGAGDD